MRRHAESLRDGLEILFLFVDAVSRTPPPGLMDKRSVRRVHEANDAVVDADWHFGLQVGELVLLAELFDGGSGFAGLGGFGKTCTGKARIRDVNPDEIVLLFARIASRVDAIDFHRLVRGERGDQLALTVVNIELPSVVRAFHILPVELAGVERHPAMKT